MNLVLISAGILGFIGALGLMYQAAKPAHITVKPLSTRWLNDHEYDKGGYRD